MPETGLNVRTKILIVFLALSVISLVVTGFVALMTISDMGQYAQKSSSELGRDAVHDSTVALENATAQYLVRVATDQATMISEIFWISQNELNILADQALSVENNPDYQSRVTGYPPSVQPPDPGAATVIIRAPDATLPEGSDEYRALAGMDDLLASVYQNDGELTSVYVVSSSGVMRAYPWEGGIAPGFDPRDRPWFRAALAEPDHPVWTEPYVDASGHGLIMTCSRSVKTKYGTWVIASDVTTDQIYKYTSVPFSNNGYPVLVDSRGTVISRPGLSANGTLWNQPFSAGNIFQYNDRSLSAIGRDMIAGKTGIKEVTFNGSRSIVAYAPVSYLNWSYAVSLPAAEIVKPILATEKRIEDATKDANTRIKGETAEIQYLFGGLFCLLMVIVIILSWLLARIITRPVDALKAGATALGRGDLDVRVTIHSGDEFEELAGSFNQMASDLRANIENLKKTTAEKERYTKELEIAKEIQDTFLPESEPEIPGYEIAAVTHPAMEIGGDLYDFIPVGPDRWGFVIADVSGKGVSAALFMALCRTLLHASGQAEPDPSQAIARANRLISEDGRSSMFITVFYGILDRQERSFTYVNAGHNPPVLVRADEPGTRELDGRGIALGVVDDVEIAPVTLPLMSGDLLVLYTDGVTEAFNERDEYFGEARLGDCLLRNRGLPVKEILAALLGEIRTFAGSAPQSDDITLVLIRVK